MSPAEFVLVAGASLSVSALTLYSGFGLGTLLLPVFALFFPLDVAVAATAIVHGANNIFKICVVGKYADTSLVLRFGVPAILAAFAGAAALGYVAHLGEIARYSLGPRTAVITPIKLVMAVLMLVFSLFELLPPLRRLQFDRKYLFLGGLLSGFFGGFSGHQGALRSAFLVKVGISTEAFVGTNAAIGFLVDLARIATYAVLLAAARTSSGIEAHQWPLIATGIVAAFAGVVVGRRFLHRITMRTVQILTGVLLLGIAFALGSGIV
ncbi:MAG: TSUP family transporter [Planctomycetes bacterium]|nr:TSUP family transporter [Planctomycetota bacterium]